jgi:hypothetical protein
MTGRHTQYAPMLDSGVGIDLPNGETVFIHNDADLRDLIVRAVNAHDALVAALQGALAEHDYKRTQQVMLTEPRWVDVARAALLLAKHGAAPASTTEEAV